ncbi:phage tail tape measure protein [uncultured Muribaculum sp.]|uniref:phage tail tape measure protein n=1 Tax=uncultured Muribaculum sp. TaxID=1918613 RepID=UPI0026708D5A|nr:phage tail tape measure protein [uncultured Muribaculum sp.]
MALDSTISISFKMSEDANGLKRIAMDAEELRKAMAEAVKVSKQLESNFINFAAISTGVRAAADSVNQLSSFLRELTAESTEFNHAMRAANTMAGKDAAGFDRLKDEVADLAKVVPVAREQLANGLYQTISNGVPENNWVEFLNASARSAVGGIADINKVVGVTSTIIKNYGLEWDAAAAIQDKIQLTAKNGVTSFEQLAQALPRVTGNAATLGVSVDELMGTFATLTGVSGNTAEVSTQLAAIFTALVKPSSEAAEMAAKMGIQFDAAAIKAAGGFQNFLQHLDGSIKKYAQATGTLEQEIYGRLFGSAEALRALIPLQGELADKFTANVANMVNSAGTMNQAFSEMSSTGEARAQKLKNQWAGVTDFITDFVVAIQPFLDLFSGLLTSAASVFILAKSFSVLNAAVSTNITALKAFWVSTTAITSSTSGLAKGIGTARLFITQLGAAVMQGTKGLRLFATAWKGLLISSGIGIAIAAVTGIIAYFALRTDEAAAATNKLLDSEARAKREAEQLEQIRQQEESTMKANTAALELNIAKLKEFSGTREQEQKLVSEMNNTYGSTMGYFSSVSDWYKALTANSEAYCRQMVIEARTRMLADQIAQKEQEKHDIIYDEKGNKRKYSTEDKWVQDKDNVIGNVNGSAIYGHKREASDHEKATAAVKKLSQEKEALAKHLEDAVKEAASIEFSIKGDSTPPNTTNIPTYDKQKDKQIPEGSKDYYKNQASDLNRKIGLELDPSKKSELMRQLMEVEAILRGLEWQEHRIRLDYEFPDFKPLKPEDLAPGKIELTEYFGIEKLKKSLPEVKEQIKGAVNSVKNSAVEKLQKNFEDTRVNLGALSGFMGSLSGMTDESTAAMMQWGEQLLSTAASVLPAIQAVTMALAAKSAAEAPVVGWINAIAAIAAIGSAFISLPKFADGGIVSGPTVGLIGEYAGASNNPEVVAPLDKLRGMLNPAGQPVIVGGTLRASGRDIVCVLANETRIASKSGRKTNIKL